MAVLPPLQAPRRADESLVLVPVAAPTPIGLAALIAGAAFLLDQATKTLAVATLVPSRLVELAPDVLPGWGWQLIYNPGGALGFSPDGLFGSLLGRWFFLLVTATVTLVVVRTLPRARLLRSGVAHGLLLAGAWGNGFDRLVRPPGFPTGNVVDFVALRVPDWVPVLPRDLARFNVADVAIIIGFVLLFAAARAEERLLDADT